MDSRTRFEALYQAHCGAVRSFVHRRASPAAADDAVADIFVIAWRRRAETPDDPLPWLLGIARGVLANQRRGEARMSGLLDRLAASTITGAQDGPERSADDREGVMHALGSLSRLDQEVLLLVAWDGLDRPQAATVLGITKGLFAVRLHRARRRLKRALEAQQHQPEQQADDPPAVEAL